MTTSERQMTTPSSELMVACRKSYGKTISATAPTIAAIALHLKQPLRTGHCREPLLDELSAAGQARAPQEEGEDDDEEDEELGQPAERGAPGVGREPALCSPVDEERLDHADREAGEARDEERGEAGEERGGERGHDLEGERLRVERDKRRDEHAEASGDDAREHRVHDRQAARREPDEHRRDLVLRRGSRGQSEGRPAKERRQRRRDEDHDPREQEPVLGTTRSKIVTVSEGRTDGADFRLLPKIRIMPDSSTSRRPSDAASLASGAVFRSGRKIASSITTPNTAMQTSVRANAGTERAGTEVARPERPEEVRSDHRDRAHGDVDHARAPVDEDDAERNARDQRARAEPERRVEEDVPHRSSTHETAGPALPGPPSRLVLYFAPGGFSQLVTVFHLPLPTYL